MKQVGVTVIPPPGSFVYAYCHVRTNQVLYSLTRTLQPEHLKQLPDVGANNTPPTLRKDSWRPLFTVTMPQNEAGYEHGLYIMKKLREYRKLHETNWKPSPLMSRPYTQTEIDKMQKDLDSRGGSKKETVYDIIKRKKWAMRVKSVMDQKANSVADLAAILETTEERAKKARERNERDRLRHKDLTYREMLDLEKKAASGEVQVLESRRAQLQEEFKSLTYKQKKRMQREIDGLTLKIEMMLFASKALTDARKDAQSQLAADAEKAASPGASAESTPRSEEQILLDILPSWPEKIDPWLIVANRKGGVIPKGLANREILNFNRPVHSTEGIVISWANPLDQEYASKWPDTIEWRPMGLTRHVAQIPLASPHNPWQQEPDGEEKTSDGPIDVSTFKQWQLSKRGREESATRQRTVLLNQIKDDVLASVTSQRAHDTAEDDVELVEQLDNESPGLEPVEQADSGNVRPETRA